MATPRASLVVQTVENLPAMRETWVLSPGWEEPRTEGMATHSSTLAWKIPLEQRSLAAYSPWSCNESDMTERLGRAQQSGILVAASSRWCQTSYTAQDRPLTKYLLSSKCQSCRDREPCSRASLMNLRCKSQPHQ